MKKKLMCFMMGAMLVISSLPAVAYADSAEPEPIELSTEGVQDLLEESDVSKSIIGSEAETITSEVEILNAFGYNTNSIASAELKHGEIIYNIEVNGTSGYNQDIEAEISIMEDDDGDVSMNITEDSIEAVLVFGNDGKIFLDGKEIVISESTVATVEGSAIYRMTSVPYGCGSASKYSYYGGIRNWNIEFNNLICKTAVVVCASVIAWGVGGGLGVAVLLPTSNQIVNYASSSDGKALSAKSTMYFNKDYKRFMISSSQGCRKEYTDFYSTGNYSKKMNKTPLVSYYYFMMPGC